MERIEDFRLRYSWDMILSIQDFIDCISHHKSDLKSPRNIGLMHFERDFNNNKEYNPAGVLKDYIYLEANSFFQYAKKLKNKGKKYEDLPELPNYLKELENFRNKVVGHRDFKESFNSPQDWLEAHRKITKIIPIPKLIKEVDEYFKEVLRIKKEKFIKDYEKRRYGKS